MSERIDADPVTRLAPGAAQELPCPFALHRQGAFEETEGVPARLELGLAEEPIGDEQERRRAVGTSRIAKATCDGRQQRPADAVDGTDAWSDALLAGEVLRVGEAAKRRGQRLGEPVRVVEVLGEVATQLFSVGPMGCHECDGTLRRLAAGR